MEELKNRKICVTKNCNNQNYFISTKFCPKCGNKSVESKEGKEFIKKICRNIDCHNKKIQYCSVEKFCQNCADELSEF